MKTRPFDSWTWSWHLNTGEVHYLVPTVHVCCNKMTIQNHKSSSPSMMEQSWNVLYKSNTVTKNDTQVYYSIWIPVSSSINVTVGLLRSWELYFALSYYFKSVALIRNERRLWILSCFYFHDIFLSLYEKQQGGNINMVQLSLRFNPTSGRLSGGCEHQSCPLVEWSGFEMVFWKLQKTMSGIEMVCLIHNLCCYPKNWLKYPLQH